MFTGIILAIGKIVVIESYKGDCRLKIDTGALSLTDCALGDSIAVDGVCLTAVELGSNYFYADVSNETLSCTTLAKLKSGSPVNLELALTPSTRMGGHIVSGHVDGIGQVIDKTADARSIRFKLQAPDLIAKYIAEKGSICINGISLTVNKVNGSVFDVNIVPHTLQKTTLHNAVIGTAVNLEVDVLARYTERLLHNQANPPTHNSHLTEDLLHRSGFF
jgi:riboflavin synthase